ncbi:MAG: 7TM domain-containing protein [Pirellulaceae bacterium]|nr:7TM domain-containing protein [Pirellulaceae bacterium]
MYERKTAPWVVGSFLLLGCTAIGLRMHALNQTALTDISGLWRLRYVINLETDQPGVQIQLAVPRDTRHAKVVRQNFSYSDLRQERLKTSASQTKMTLVAPQPGHYEISARFDLSIQQPKAKFVDSEPAPTEKEMARYLRATSSIQTQSLVVTDLLASIRQENGSKPEWVQSIFDYCHTGIESSERIDLPSDAESVLRSGIGTSLGRVRAMLALCRAAGIPARLVTGFEIQDEPDTFAEYWLEAYIGNVWEPYDPSRGFAHQMPAEFIPLCRESIDIVDVSPEGTAEIEYSVYRVGQGGFASATNRHPADIFDLNRLPLSMHDSISIILLLPFGALVTAIFQTMIGIRTIGTFSPTLIALSFVLADWRTGAAVFALVVLVGILSRSLLDRLKLLMVPRLGFMLTLVVAILVFTISILDYFRFTPSHQAVLLPLVILTMTVERFYVATAEDGIHSALKLMLGTIVVSFCCFLTLRWHQVGMLVFHFPEVHLLTLAAFVYLGRYTGYRLTELWRFRDLVGGNGEAGGR